MPGERFEHLEEDRPLSQKSDPIRSDIDYHAALGDFEDAAGSLADLEARMQTYRDLEY